MNKRILYCIFLCALFGMALWGCKKDYALVSTSGPVPYTIPIPKGFSSDPADMNQRPDNPVTVEGVALGRMLFYEKKLSGNNTQSCGSCHKQEFAFTDGLAFGIGERGLATPRGTMPIFNLLWSKSFTWNGGMPNLEEQLVVPITNPIEMNQDLNLLVNELQTDPNYPYLFKKAFGTDSITIPLIQKAIAQFERSIVSGNSKYDRYLQRTASLTNDEFQGSLLFADMQKGDCVHCHTIGGTFTNFDFKHNGLDTAITGSTIDVGRYPITKDGTDSMKFKTPSLRNIALTAPYMHDGRLKTLEEVIDFYDSGFHYNKNLDVNMALLPKKRLTPLEKKQIVAFLKTLTDTDLTTNKAYSDPFK